MIGVILPLPKQQLCSQNLADYSMPSRLMFLMPKRCVSSASVTMMGQERLTLRSFLLSFMPLIQVRVVAGDDENDGNDDDE